MRDDAVPGAQVRISGRYEANGGGGRAEIAVRRSYVLEVIELPRRPRRHQLAQAAATGMSSEGGMTARRCPIRVCFVSR